MLEYNSTAIASILWKLLHRYAKVQIAKKNLYSSNNMLELTLTLPLII